MAPSEAEKQGYERASKHPKSTKYGRQNPIAERWNSEEQLVHGARRGRMSRTTIWSLLVVRSASTIEVMQTVGWMNSQQFTKAWLPVRWKLSPVLSVSTYGRKNSRFVKSDSKQSKTRIVTMSDKAHQHIYHYKSPNFQKENWDLN